MNRFLLLKCISLGALCFPTPFLFYFYVFSIYPQPDESLSRFVVVIFLILSGGMLGTMFYYKDSAVEALKDWFPSEKKR